ncbi:MAG: LytR C-terminal domain-containing protein [Endomicrobium sp.]|nr:LytR C-terminal domain-containing protein [Endomicrobium sp.]
MSFIFLLYDVEKVFSERFNAYVFLYDKKTNILKILSINPDVVIFKERERARSLKECFYKNSKKSINMAVKNFYSNLQKVMGSVAATNFYISTSFKRFDIMTGRDKEFKLILSKNNFEDKNLDSLNCFEMVERILYLIPCKIIKILKSYSFFDTNVSKLSFLLSFVGFKFLNPILMFCEMPVKYKNTRVELDKQNIEEFLSKVYFNSLTSQIDTNELLVDVKNASKKPRAAEETTWFLRENNFDILDWGNFYGIYNETLIKDYKGNFKQALKIAEALKIGKVIVSYNNNIYYDISVIIGKDYKQCNNPSAN